MTDLLNLEVDLLLSGATSACIELDAEDEPVPRDMHGRVATSPERADGKRRGSRGSTTAGFLGGQPPLPAPVAPSRRAAPGLALRRTGG